MAYGRTKNQFGVGFCMEVDRLVRRFEHREFTGPPPARVPQDFPCLARPSKRRDRSSGRSNEFCLGYTMVYLPCVTRKARISS
jgi:hypothetical protein